MHALHKLFHLDPAVTFLNHGSYGACPKDVLAAYHDSQVQLEKEPCEFLNRSFNQRLAEARQVLAQYVHCDPLDIIFMTNATMAENLVARSLPLKAGDEILTTDHEYGAVDRTWQFVSEKRGAYYRKQPIELPLSSDDAFVEQFWQGVNERTKVIHLSHITSPTALIFPIAEICRRAREAGIISVIDGAHAVGQIPLDMQHIGADFYTSNCHKWLCAPKGCAFLYANRTKQALLEPLIVSWGWRPEKPGLSRFIDENEWLGTRDPCPFLAINAVLDFMQQHQWDTVRQRCHELAVATRQRLLDILQTPALCQEQQFAQMFAVELPVKDGRLWQQQLWQHDRVEVLGVNWNDRAFMRISVQGYNDEQDMDKMLHAVQQQLERETGS